MTCQHCQTWILDEEHRCHRCGRRVRSIPEKLFSGAPSPSRAATAQAYDWDYESQAANHRQDERTEPSLLSERDRQPQLFTESYFDGSTDSRVIPFDSLTSRVELQAIRARAAGLERPFPLKTEKVQVKRVRQARKERQRKLEFEHQTEFVPQVKSSIICDSAVAPVGMRVHAAVIDLLLMSLPCGLGLGIFIYVGGGVSLDKYALPFLLAALATIPVLYQLLWTIAAADTPGMHAAGISLVDFDGNPPSRSRRFQRCLGGFLSLLAAGVGILWSLVDEDRLTWHDHISSTFPTPN